MLRDAKGSWERQGWRAVERWSTMKGRRFEEGCQPRSGDTLVWFPDPSTHKIRACAYNACACEKEGSGTELYPNAGQGWNVRKGVRMQLWI